MGGGGENKNGLIDLRLDTATMSIFMGESWGSLALYNSFIYSLCPTSMDRY